MKLNNHKNGIINYGTPFGRAFRRGPRRWSALSYNDRSPELWAMNAYLRVSAHRGKKRNSTNSIARRNGESATPTGSFVNLLRAYDNQVSANFTREAVLFGIITMIGLVLPIAYLARILPH